MSAAQFAAGVLEEEIPKEERRIILNALRDAAGNVDEAADACKKLLPQYSSAEQRRILIRKVALAGC